jgi:hypothetical protein
MHEALGSILSSIQHHKERGEFVLSKICSRIKLPWDVLRVYKKENTLQFPSYQALEWSSSQSQKVEWSLQRLGGVH